MKTEKRLEQPAFYSQIFRLVLPIVIQNLLSAAVSSADVVMLNYVGQSSISAVSLASQYASVLFMVFYGLGTGVTILCAQYYGKGDMRAIQVVEGIALRFSIPISLAFAGAALLIPDKMMLLFTDDAGLIAVGASYLRYMSAAYVCWGVTEVYLAVLRSINRVMVSMAMNILAFSLNIVLNAVWIFGLFGAPKLGAMGVALATSLSRFIELGACMAVSGFSRDIHLNPKYIFIRNQTLFNDFVRLSLPALGNDISWSVAFSMYSVIIGHLGSDAVAANSFVGVVRNFGTVLCFGMASAGGILLGNIIGENRLEEARDGAKKLMKLTVITGAIGGAVILAATPLALAYAGESLSEQAMYYLKRMLLINTYYVMGAAVNTTLIAGVFRAGGDSRFGFVCDTITMWCYAVPLGFIAAFALKLPVMWVYFLLCTDEFVKWPWVIKHYRSGKWLNNITREGLFAGEACQDAGN
ncbi:MAG: MATE family efflux transporter [Oscillospiraceae bacterium]|nr:MATE family efflux transporter [Oscillospiraceae bacterium]